MLQGYQQDLSELLITIVTCRIKNPLYKVLSVSLSFLFLSILLLLLLFYVDLIG